MIKKKLKITPLAKTVEPTVYACTEAQKSKEKSVGFVDWRFDRKIGLGVCRLTSTHRHCHRPYTRLIINKNYFHDSIIKRDCFFFFLHRLSCVYALCVFIEPLRSSTLTRRFCRLRVMLHSLRSSRTRHTLHSVYTFCFLLGANRNSIENPSSNDNGVCDVKPYSVCWRPHTVVCCVKARLVIKIFFFFERGLKYKTCLHIIFYVHITGAYNWCKTVCST